MATQRSPGLRMVGGTGTGSYHSFSKSLQSNLNVFFWPHLSHAIAEAFGRQLAHNAAAEPPDRFAIADFGCACAESSVNSMQYVARCVGDHVYANRTSDVASPAEQSQLYLQAFFNDLPSNDFNSLFALFSSSQLPSGLRFISCGLPGSFYSSLFPPRFLCAGLCTLSLHNLSKVPDAVQNPSSPAWNENGIWILEGCKAETAMAYKEQFLDDFTCFLQHRSEELVPGGLLFCVIIASKRADRTSLHRVEDTKLMSHVQTAWRELISEGSLEQISLDKFNLPLFTPTLNEVKEAICTTAVGRKFEVLRMESADVERAPKEAWMETAAADAETWGRTCETMARNFWGSLIQPHLEPAKFELLMERVRTLGAADDNLKSVHMLNVIELALVRR